jgi:hypothetical protein
MPKIFLALAAGSLTLLAAATAAAPLAAQVVGHAPERSPYRDLDVSQRFTIFAGYFDTQKDEIGATPQSGPTFGLRYDIPVAGPADFYARLQRVSSHRESFDPTLLASARDLGRQSIGLYVADLGFDLNLTGRRSWHGIIPAVGFGAGIATAPAAGGRDPYDFGTTFAFTMEGGLRFNPSNSYEFRLNVSPTFYQNHYPVGYFVAPPGGAPLLATSTARSGFRHALDYTAGLSIPLFR